MKAQDLTDHLAENPVDEDYGPLKTYFPDEEMLHVDEVDLNEKLGWKIIFDRAANMKGVGIGIVLISEIGQHYLVTAQLRFYYTNNMDEYEACILGLRLAIDMGVQEILVLGDLDLLVHRIQGEWETRDLKLILYRQCLHDLCQWFRHPHGERSLTLQNLTEVFEETRVGHSDLGIPRGRALAQRIKGIMDRNLDDTVLHLTLHLGILLYSSYF
ncbi:uncharacterized protein LOC142164085 [Nicotiana tabacum]|uniref:Uncharacterized protein LOC142164085 n=1 Tax=Nicotiana tabacum TaxID=4097 RepID=A0AC58RXA4_TOBAC